MAQQLSLSEEARLRTIILAWNVPRNEMTKRNLVTYLKAAREYDLAKKIDNLPIAEVGDLVRQLLKPTQAPIPRNSKRAQGNFTIVETILLLLLVIVTFGGGVFLWLNPSVQSQVAAWTKASNATPIPAKPSQAPQPTARPGQPIVPTAGNKGPEASAQSPNSPIPDGKGRLICATPECTVHTALSAYDFRDPSQAQNIEAEYLITFNNLLEVYKDDPNRNTTVPEALLNAMTVDKRMVSKIQKPPVVSFNPNKTTGSPPTVDYSQTPIVINPVSPTPGNTSGTLPTPPRGTSVQNGTTATGGGDLPAGPVCFREFTDTQMVVQVAGKTYNIPRFTKNPALIERGVNWRDPFLWDSGGFNELGMEKCGSQVQAVPEKTVLPTPTQNAASPVQQQQPTVSAAAPKVTSSCVVFVGPATATVVEGDSSRGVDLAATGYRWNNGKLEGGNIPLCSGATLSPPAPPPVPTVGGQQVQPTRIPTVAAQAKPPVSIPTPSNPPTPAPAPKAHNVCWEAYTADSLLIQADGYGRTISRFNPLDKLAEFYKLDWRQATPPFDTGGWNEKGLDKCSAPYQQPIMYSCYYETGDGVMLVKGDGSRIPIKLDVYNVIPGFEWDNSSYKLHPTTKAPVCNPLGGMVLQNQPTTAPPQMPTLTPAWKPGAPAIIYQHTRAEMIAMCNNAQHNFTVGTGVPCDRFVDDTIHLNNGNLDLSFVGVQYAITVNNRQMAEAAARPTLTPVPTMVPTNNTCLSIYRPRVLSADVMQDGRRIKYDNLSDQNQVPLPAGSWEFKVANSDMGPIKQWVPNSSLTKCPGYWEDLPSPGY